MCRVYFRAQTYVFVCKYIPFLHSFFRLKVTLIITIHIFRCFVASSLLATRFYLSLFITFFLALPLTASSLPLNLSIALRPVVLFSRTHSTHAPRSRSPSLHARKYRTRARASTLLKKFRSSPVLLSLYRFFSSM